MKKLLLPSLLTALLLANLSAQDATPATPTPKGTATPPPADPFVRDRAAKPPTPPATPTPEPPPVNVLTTLETWSLSQADFAALLDGPGDERAPYDRLEALAKAGKAKLLGLQAISTRPGNRTVVEAIDELRYPIEFDAAKREGEKATPTTYETRNTGETLELEPVVHENGHTIDISLAPSAVRLHRFQDWKADETSAPVTQPQIQTEKLQTSLAVQSGRPVLLSTATPAGMDKAADSLRVRVLRAAVERVQPPPTLVANPLEVRIDLLVYSLEREAARRILAESADSVQSYAAVRELVNKGAAQLEAVTSFLNKSGQRAVNEEIYEYRYPTVMSPPGGEAASPKENQRPASFTAFETRNTGLTVEIEPVLSADGQFVEINIVPQIIKVNGLIRRSGDLVEFPPQPLITTRKLTTSVASGAGQPVLLGTLSQPQDTGVNERKDDGRTSLAFLRVTPIRP